MRVDVNELFNIRPDARLFYQSTERFPAFLR